MSYSADARRLAINAYKNSEWSIRETAKILELSPTSLHEWVKRDEAGESLEDRVRQTPAVPRRLTPEQVNALIELTEQYPDWTQQRYAERLNELFDGLSISQQGVSHELKRAKVSFKKKRGAQTQRKPSGSKKLTTVFLIAREDLDMRDLVFIDECGVNTGMAREYGYAPKGARLFDSKPSKYLPNHTVLGALSLDGLGALMTIQGGTSVEVFFAWVEQVLLPELDTNNIVVLDNLAAHKNKRVVELFGDHGIDLLYTPPYSPEWNPIEWAWSKVKNHLRKAAARCLDSLEDALVDAADLVTQDDAFNMITGCGYGVPGLI